MVFIIGITLTFFLEFLLLSKRSKSSADIILALWLFFTGIQLFLFYLQYAGLFEQFPALIGIIIPLPLVHGPFLFLYVSNLTGQVPRKRYLQLIHFATPFLVYVYMIHFFILPASEKIAIIKSGGAGYEAFSAINLVLIVISGIGYVTASQILLQRYRKRIREEYSNIERISLKWLRYNVWGIGAIWVAVLLGTPIFADHLSQYGIDADVFVFSTVVVFVCFLGFFGLRQPNVFVAGTRTTYPRSSMNGSKRISTITLTATASRSSFVWFLIRKKSISLCFPLPSTADLIPSPRSTPASKRQPVKPLPST